MLLVRQELLEETKKSVLIFALLLVYPTQNCHLLGQLPSRQFLLQRYFYVLFSYIPSYANVSGSEFFPGKPLVCFNIALAGFLNDIFRKRRDGGLLIPVKGQKVVAHKLLVEAALRSARRV